MLSQSAVFDIPQNRLPMGRGFYQDEFYKDFDDQQIRAEPRRNRPTTDPESYFVQPKKDFTEQRRTLYRHYMFLDDDGIIARLLETKLEFYSPVTGFTQLGRSSPSRFEYPVTLEIYELLEDASDDEYEGRTAAKSKSVSYAVIFAKNILDKCKTRPEVDLHPDGEVSLTWRSNRGIINIAFGEYGTATYAAYFSLHKETHKGRFSVSSVIPETILNIIERIEKQ
jgi:hypothetical protein